MRILFVAAECAPFVKTGGLGDVASSLPPALAAEGASVRLLMPAYRDAVRDLPAGDVCVRFEDLFGGPAEVRALSVGNLDLLLLHAPHLYDRPGNPYVRADGSDWPDNHLRFGALGRVAAELAVAGIDGWRPDAVHAHDWHAGLAPFYLSRLDGAPPSVMTIHNIMYQGLFPAAVAAPLGLPADGFTPAGYEFFGKVGFLKAGLVYADRVTTVSPTYARELLAPDFGLGLEGVLAARGDDFVGILNGVDLEVWNPASDPLIAATYKAPNKRARVRNRRAVEARFGLEPDPAAPLFCVISRMTRQKGLDLLLDAVPTLLQGGAKLAVLGSGDSDLEHAFRDIAKRNPGDVGAVIGYDEPLAHRLQAGADAIVVPSRFEPCGLTQLYGLRYGCLPVVSETGGLADTVTDADADPGHGTGFVARPDDPASLRDALDRAVACYRDPDRWRAVMRRAMKRPVGWNASARAYLDLYDDLRPEAEAAA